MSTKSTLVKNKKTSKQLSAKTITFIFIFLSVLAASIVTATRPTQDLATASTTQPSTQYQHAADQEWAGYVLTQVTGGLTSVSANWHVAAVTCDQTPALTRTVINLGLRGGGAEVLGAEANCINGNAAYFGIETVNGANKGFTKIGDLSPGTSISASITTVGTGKYRLKMQTPQWTYDKTLNGGSSTLDSDLGNCVVERDNFSQTPIPLANFGIQKITGCTVDGIPIGSGPYQNIYRMLLERSDQTPLVLAEPDESTNGSDFTITWYLTH